MLPGSDVFICAVHSVVLASQQNIDKECIEQRQLLTREVKRKEELELQLRKDCDAEAARATEQARINNDLAAQLIAERVIKERHANERSERAKKEAVAAALRTRVTERIAMWGGLDKGHMCTFALRATLARASQH